MLYRIKAGPHECYLVRQFLASVMKIAHRKAERLPFGEYVLVFRGNVLVARATRIDLFDGLDDEAAN
jgi:hypothetical protein